MLIRSLPLVLLLVSLAACAPSHDGDVLWRFEIKKTHMQWAVADGGRLYLCADDVYCLDIATGHLLWEFKTFGTHASAPVVEDGKLFFQCGGLYALDAATGELLWEFWTDTWAASSPAAGSGRVFALSGRRLYCLDSTDGTVLWSAETGPDAVSPVFAGDVLCLGIGPHVRCFDASSGAPLWAYWIGGTRVHQLIMSGDVLISVGREGLVRAHRATTGDVLWQQAYTIPLVHLCAADEGHLLISAVSLSCVEPENGDLVWTLNHEGQAVRDAHFLGQYVFARTFGGELLCIAMQDGALVSSIRLPSGGRLVPLGSDAIFFPGGRSRNVSCVRMPQL